MSASREKKQRQGGTPTDKTLTETQKTDQTRRKTVQYTVIGVVVAVLVAALLIWNSGIFQSRATAVTTGGTSYSAAQTSYFYHSSYAYRMILNYAQYGMVDYDTTKSPADQPYGEEGETYHDYFMDAAMEDLSAITSLYDAALADKDMGVTAADVQSDVDDAVESMKQAAAQNSVSLKQYLKSVYGNYMTLSVFKDCVTRTLVADRYQENYKNSLEYSNEQLQAYYEEHKDDLDSFRYAYVNFVPEEVETQDADGNEIEMTDEEKSAAEEENLAAAKEKADGAKAALEDGKSLDDVISEFEVTSYGKDETTQGSGLSNAPYGEWLKSADRQAGDVEVVENGANGYYVVVFTERFLDETPTVDTRHILVRAEMDDGASEPTDEQMAAAKAKAEELLDQWKNGAATEDSFAELANANSDDGGSNTNGGLYENVYQGQFVTNYNDWLFDSARQPGDTDIVENRGEYYGYHVVYYVKQNPDWFKWMTESESALASEDTNNWLEDLRANYTAEKASGADYLK